MKKTYTIKNVSGPVDWEDVPALMVDQVLWCADTGIRAQGQFCYDEENLYVHLSAAEKVIRAENTEPLSPVHEDSCLEFFFRIPGSENYFNFEINPNGCVCIQAGPNRNDRVFLVRKDAVDYFAIRTNRTEAGWEVFYRIPLDFIRLFYPGYRFGGTLEANVYKCGDRTVNEHYLAWNPVDLENPDFHRPEFFGTFNFA